MEFRAYKLLSFILLLICSVFVFSIAAIWIDWAAKAALVANALLWPIALAMVGVLAGAVEQLGGFNHREESDGL